MGSSSAAFAWGHSAEEFVAKGLASRHETASMIYHIPGHAAVSMSTDSPAEIRVESSHFVGMEHAANGLAQVRRLRASPHLHYGTV